MPDKKVEKNISGPQGKPDGKEPLICPDCNHGRAGAAVREILSSCGLTITAEGCHIINHALPLEPGDTLSPVTGCGISCIRMETRGNELTVVIGTPAFFRGGHPVTAGPKGRVLMLLENTGAEERADGDGSLSCLEQTARALGAAKVFPCDPFSMEGLAGLVRKALDCPVPNAVIACQPF